MSIKQNDFVEIDYIGYNKEDNSVFDTTLEQVAKQNELHHEGHDCKPAIICVGQHQILKAIDESLIGKSSGEKFSIELTPENSFGKKNPELIQFIPISSYRDSQINPVPGLPVDIDGSYGIVKIVSGGRTLVDFNHPLAGKSVKYEITINRIVEDKKEKLSAYLSGIMGFEPEIEIKDSEAILKVPKGIEEHEKEIQDKVKEVIPEITTLKFTQIADKK